MLVAFADIFVWTWKIWGGCTQNSSKHQKNSSFCEELLSENDCFISFCCYDYGANTSEERLAQRHWSCMKTP